MINMSDTAIEKAKYWFGGGEVDVDAMINAGVISLDIIIKMYKEEVLNNIRRIK